MADYTKVNLKEVEDAAPRFGMGPDIEARFARTALRLEKSGVSYFRLGPGFRVSFGHFHREQEEVYLLLRGSARIRVDGDLVELEPWDAIRVPPEAVRGLQAGPEGAEYVAYGAPSTGSQDAEMVTDWWTD